MLQQFKLPVVQVYNVTLQNTGEDGMLLVTNFRLVFLAAGSALLPAPLADIPLTIIDRVTKNISSKTALALVRMHRVSLSESGQAGARLMHVATKDLRHVVLAFRPHTKQRRLIFDTLQRVGKPARLQELYAFAGSTANSSEAGGQQFGMENAFDRLRKEYERVVQQAECNLVRCGAMMRARCISHHLGSFSSAFEQFELHTSPLPLCSVYISYMYIHIQNAILPF